MFRREQVQIIAVNKNSVAYAPIPKCACTSIKNSVYIFQTGKKYDPRSMNPRKHIHDYFYGQMNNYSRLNKPEFLFCILRDPIERFLSAYSNRVLHHLELSEEKVQSNEIKDLIRRKTPGFTPGLNDFIKHYRIYRQVPSISHHSKSIKHFIGSDLNIFDGIYKIQDIPKLEIELSKRLDCSFSIDREQTGGPKISLDKITPSNFVKLLILYFGDYLLINNYYSVGQVVSKYRELRALE